jgi:2,5-diamino-6-(ribosylamino)-4(3H)-pyrimidinone 5'-phosphate reductase
MRPYVFVNVATSADGKLSTRERRQVKISGKNDFSRVDRLKAGSDAIMVGIGTVLADDPSLTVKSPELKAERKGKGMDEHPVRIVVDSRLRIPIASSVLHKGEGKRIIACAGCADSGRIDERKELATIIVCGETEVDLTCLLEKLYDMGIRRLMVEGGGSIIWSLMSAGLVDQLTCFIGNIIIGGKEAPTLADGTGFIHESEFVRLELAGLERMDDGVLLTWNVLPGHLSG